MKSEKNTVLIEKHMLWYAVSSNYAPKIWLEKIVMPISAFNYD